jgi:hypothetical protein
MAGPGNDPLPTILPPGLLAGIGASALLVGVVMTGVTGLRTLATPKSPAQVSLGPGPAQASQEPRPSEPAPESPPDALPISTDEPRPPIAPPSSLPAELQEKVNAAVARGVEHLQKTQAADGLWRGSPPAALSALCGLTLLECGVAPNDEQIAKAARKVRAAVADQSAGQHTYTASLMLLFLDRLGDPGDAQHIRTLALRLVAGQNQDGGWTYTLPRLSSDNEDRLMQALAMTRPSGLEKIIRRPANPGVPGKITKEGPGGGGLDRLTGGKPPKEDEVQKALDDLPDGFRDLPAFRDELARPGAQPGKKGGGKDRKGGKGPLPMVRGNITSDNSNTQFAALALWASLRHGIPMERALQRMGDRFRKSQRANGSWGYHAAQAGWGSEAMTGVGLLGLAISTGLAEEKKPAARDPDIDRAFVALAKNIRSDGPSNLYFWWTVERVAMLYSLKEIEDKDWYRLACEMLVIRQQKDGGWAMGGYPGANGTVDTCFALLILKRVNLAPELTTALEGRLITGK